MLKRVYAVLLALVWALTLTACDFSEASSLPAASLPVASGPVTASQAPSARPSSAPEETPGPESAAPASQTPESEAPESRTPETPAPAVAEDGWYHTKDEVALYIHLYGHLPGNYVTKRQAQDMGWTGGGVERYAGEGTAIGGSRFGNYEGLLPEAEGRTYTECDIDTVGSSSRGAKRVVFSNDGLVYYTGDHYQSFELLYGEP